MDKKKLLYGIGAVVLAAITVFCLSFAVKTDAKYDVVTQDLADANIVINDLTQNFEDVKGQLASVNQDLADTQTALSEKKSELVAATAAQKEAERKLADKEAAAKEAKALAGAVAEGKIKDGIFLGDQIKFNYDDGDVPVLVDGEIRFNDDEYDVEERVIANEAMFLAFSLIDDEEFGANPYVIMTDREILEYRYEFMDPVDMTEISDDESLEILFLGQPVELVEADEDGIVLRNGQTFFLKEGEAVVVDGKTVTLAFVGENDRAGVCVDDDCEVVDEYDSERVGGLDVRVEDILVNARAGSATLVVGQDTLFDQDDDAEYLGMESWKFRMETDGDELEALVVTYDEIRKDADDDFVPLALGEELCFPNDFVCMKFYKVLYTDYESFSVRFKEFDEELENSTDVSDKACVVLNAGRNIFEISDEETDVLYVCYDGTAYYEDNSNDWFEGDVADVAVVNDDYELSVSVGGNGNLKFKTPLNEVIKLDTDFANEKLGAEEDDAESSDVIMSDESIGKREYDVLGLSGVVVENVENNADRDVVVVRVPSDIVEAEVLVYSK